MKKTQEKLMEMESEERAIELMVEVYMLGNAEVLNFSTQKRAEEVAKSIGETGGYKTEKGDKFFFVPNVNKIELVSVHTKTQTIYWKK